MYNRNNSLIQLNSHRWNYYYQYSVTFVTIPLACA